MNLKELIKVMLLGYRATSESYVKHLRKVGVEVGENVKMYRPFNTTIDTQNPHLLKIGNHVMMTGPVTILTHDYSWSVLKRKYSEVIGNQKYTEIGDNVFIGWGGVILAGSYIGGNTIIGAGSVVSGHLEGNAVYAGNPARKIMSLDDYYNKRKEQQLKEAVDYVKKYKGRFGCNPSLNKLDEYFFLFFDSEDKKQVEVFNIKLNLMGNFEETLKVAKNNTPLFPSYREFLNYCDKI